MAAYKLEQYIVGPDRVATVLAALHTKLETLDSSTNPIRHINTIPTCRDRDQVIGVLLYDIP